MFGTVSLSSDAPVVLERQRRLIEYAADLGFSVYCFLGGQRVVCRLRIDDEYKRLAEQSEKLIDCAAPYRLTVANHAHPLCTIESEEEQDHLLA
jgi:sugar phosphate isomerase/epimerase